MSERLPYEEQLPQRLRDVPLPDEDLAWADMERRLEEDDDDGIIAWWRKGCLGWGFLLLALLATGLWWFLNRNDHADEKKKAETFRGKIIADSIIKKDAIIAADTKDHHSIADTLVMQKDSNSTSVIKTTITDSGRYTIPASTTTSSQAPAKRTPAGSKRTVTTAPASNKNDGISKPLPKKPATGKDSVLLQPSAKPGQATMQNDTRDSSFIRTTLPVTSDSSKKAIKDTAKKIPPVAADSATQTKKKEKKSGSYFFSAGMALNQQLPVAGQKVVPYSSEGRKFSLADYIPSVYARFNKKDRWFIQGEFRYGAPQYNKPLTYSRVDDTSGTGSGVIEKQLQKTYYHQLPVSFNVYVLPNWSAGAGLVWNRFSKSLVQETLRSGSATIPSGPLDTILSQKTFISKDPVKEGISKSYFQALVESQYQWKKFSFGARYTFGLSPYIRFNLPNEPQRNEKNQSVQLFIRYQVWVKGLKE